MLLRSVTIEPKFGFGSNGSSTPISFPLIFTWFGAKNSANPAGIKTSSIFLITQALAISNQILKLQ